ncbi:hypothetical protein EV199_5183 [Pseudobacter ginsenosidimutans]|uniref:Uncharacterized protein n=1 Tax=Pseudobacter ginsenosidimutans TaxID=661488 RepID=A0A4Q7MM00_9BACT|nr:hypothetical protein EV199_5183 [Pseudobacter ginsenosidimutans]
MYGILKKMQPCGILNAVRIRFLTYQYNNQFVEKWKPASSYKFSPIKVYKILR